MFSQTAPTRTRIPFFGRSVILGCNSIFCPGTGCIRHRCAIVASAKHRLHPGKRLPNALPPASAKRENRRTAAVPPWLRRKPLRQKPLRIRKPAWIAVHDVLTEEDHRSFAKPVRPDRNVLERLAAHRPCRRIQPHRFRQHHRRVFQPRNVFKRWQPSAQNRIEFGMQSCLRLRILSQQHPRPCQRIGNRLITRQETA